MQFEEIATKLQELREGHSRATMQEVLGELKELRKVLLEEAEEAEKGQGGQGGASTVETEKLNYRILHLTQNYQELLEKSEKEKAEMQKEIDKLNYRINIMRENIKVD